MHMVKARPSPPVERMFRAFADRTRLRLLHLLRDGEMCASDIITVLGLPQAKVSRHLSYLHRAGLLEVRKKGLWKFYRLSHPDSSFHRRLIGCLGECFQGVPELETDQRRAAKLKKTGGCCPEHCLADRQARGNGKGVPPSPAPRRP